MGNEPIICDICGKEFTSTRSSFRRHLKDKHGIVESVEYGVKCMEPSCNFTCSMLKDLRTHLGSHHGLLQEVDELLFRNIEEFNMWKTQEEAQCIATWVKRHGKLKKSDAIIYYYCNRSGKRRLVPASQRVRKIKSQGSRKIDCTCTSAITARIVPEGIKVKYYKTHYGHDNKISHIPLLETTKSTIASQLMQGISPREILNKAREESMNTDTKRITKQDIHNIVREYNLYSHITNDKTKTVSSKITKLEKNHEIASTSTDLLAIQHDNDWKVLSDGDIYSIKFNSLEDNHICKQKCEECLCCVHSFSCTCVDFVVHSQMCKHMHKMGLEMLKNPLEMSEEDEAEGEEFQTTLLMDVSSEKSGADIMQEKIKRIINDIAVSDWAGISDWETLSKVNENLKAALNLMSGEQSCAKTDILLQSAVPSVAVIQLISPVMAANSPAPVLISPSTNDTSSKILQQYRPISPAITANSPAPVLISPSTNDPTTKILQKYRPIIPLDLTPRVTTDEDLESSKLLEKTSKILQKYRPIAQATEPKQPPQETLTEVNCIVSKFENIEKDTKFRQKDTKFRPSILRRKVAH